MTYLQDLRYAVRTALRDRGFTTIAVLTLALGIGANTALFTIVNAVLLAPLPFHDPDRLVRVTADFPGQHTTDAGLSIPELFDLRRSGVFDEMVGVWPVSANLTETEEPERVETALVDANYFTMLGVAPELGRLFTTADAEPGITEVAVISDAIWRRRFGGDPNVLGRRIRIDNDRYTIIGVAPASFRHPGRGTQTAVDIWAPAGWLASPFSPQPVRRAYLLQGGIGRLARGVTPIAAQTRLDTLAAELRRRYPVDYPQAAAWTWRVIPLQDDLVGHVRPALLLLLGAVGFVLLIACANVASLLLARSAARQREIAIRRTLGAGRLRLVVQLLTESVMLSAAGGAAGLLVAVWGVEALVRISPADLSRLHGIAVNGQVLAFTALLALATGIVFGLAPAVQGASADLNRVMRESGRGSAGSGRVTRLRGILVVAEFALALVLLVGAALLVQSFWRLRGVDLGFRSQSVLTARLWLPQPNDPSSGPYFTHPARVAFYRNVIARVAALPGVDAVGGVSSLPLSGLRGRMSFRIDGRSLDAGDTPSAESALATPGYFRAMGIDLVAGRVFDDHDSTDTPLVALVSETLARRYFPGEDAVGKRIVPGGRAGGNASQQVPAAAWLTIVGVVRDVRTSGVDTDGAAMVYRSVWQISNLNLSLAIHTRADPSAISEAVRREVKAVDPNEPVFAVQTMDAVVGSALAERRFSMLLLALFAGTALVLSAIGIYGVMAYFVTQRTQEIGIRIALGARSRDVLNLVIGEGIRLATYGVALGIAGALALTRAAGTLLYGVHPRDPVTFAALSVALTAVAIAACYVPARRATHVDPINALRSD